MVSLGRDLIKLFKDRDNSSLTVLCVSVCVCVYVYVCVCVCVCVCACVCVRTFEPDCSISPPALRISRPRPGPPGVSTDMKIERQPALAAALLHRLLITTSPAGRLSMPQSSCGVFPVRQPFRGRPTCSII